MPNTAINFDPSPLVAYYDNMSQEIFKMKDYMQQVKTQRENETLKYATDAKAYPLYNPLFKDTQEKLLSQYVNDVTTLSSKKGYLDFKDKLALTEKQNNLFAAQQAMLIEEARIKAQREAYEKNPEIYDEKNYYTKLDNFYTKGDIGLNLLEPARIDLVGALNDLANKDATQKIRTEQEQLLGNKVKSTQLTEGINFQTPEQKAEFTGRMYDANYVIRQEVKKRMADEGNPENLSPRDWAIKYYAPKIDTRDIDITERTYRPNSGGRSKTPIFIKQEGEYRLPVFQTGVKTNATGNEKEVSKSAGWDVVFNNFNNLSEGKSTGRILLNKPIYNQSNGSYGTMSNDFKYDLMGYGTLSNIAPKEVPVDKNQIIKTDKKGNKTGKYTKAEYNRIIEKNRTIKDWYKFINELKKEYGPAVAENFDFAVLTNQTTKERFIVPANMFIADDEIIENTQEYNVSQEGNTLGL